MVLINDLLMWFCQCSFGGYDDNLSREQTASISKKYQPEQQHELDLQYFAAEDEGRTEDPTSKELNEAREEGNVAKSEEVASALVMGMGFLTIWIFGGWMFDEIVSFSKEMMGMKRYKMVNRGNIFNIFLDIVWINAKVFLPVAAATMIGTIVANVSQVGFLFTVDPLKLDLSGVTQGLSSMFSGEMFDSETLWDFGLSVVKLIVITAVGFEVIFNHFTRLLLLVNVPITEAIVYVINMGFEIILKAIILLLVIAPIDFAWQYSVWWDGLKMSPEQVEDEEKQQEGDPQVKEKQREKMQEASQERMMDEVPEADVVITNPTHFAVALKFEEGDMAAPTIMAKGQDMTAQRIMKVAEEHGVPVYEIPMLARALFQFDLEEQIPHTLYEAVATVLAWVHENRGSIDRDEAAMVEQHVKEEGFDV